jgi:chromosome partitioning protein
MGKLIAIGNIKGGVGKTTITGQLTFAFAHHGWPIGLIDADQQCGLAG